MGDNTLTQEASSTVSNPAPYSQYFTALVGDLIGRNTGTAAVGDLEGDLGTSAIRWLNGYFKKLFIGAGGSGLSLSDSNNSLVFNAGGSEVTRMCANHRSVSLDGTDPGEGGFSVSALATFSGQPTSYTDVTGYSVSLTTRGRPVRVMCLADNSIMGGGRFGADHTPPNPPGTPGGGPFCWIKLVRNSTDVSEQLLIGTDDTLPHSNTFSKSVLLSSIRFLDIGATAGTHTFKLQTKVLTSDGNVYFTRGRLLAYELF